MIHKYNIRTKIQYKENNNSVANNVLNLMQKEPQTTNISSNAFLFAYWIKYEKNILIQLLFKNNKTANLTHATTILRSRQELKKRGFGYEDFFEDKTKHFKGKNKDDF